MLMAKIIVWGYPTLALCLFIWSLVKLNKRCALLTAGFAVLLLSYILASPLELMLPFFISTGLSEVLWHVSVVLYLVHGVLLFLGISQVASLACDHTQSSLPVSAAGSEKGRVPTSGARLLLHQVLFSFTGRVPRSTFWAVWFVMSFVSLYVRVLTNTLSSSGEAGTVAAFFVGLLYCIPLVWISLAIQVKRWHDRGRSGWMVLVNAMPIVGWIWALVELGFLRGELGPNEYGEDPLSSTHSERDN